MTEEKPDTFTSPAAVDLFKDDTITLQHIPSEVMQARLHVCLHRWICPFYVQDFPLCDYANSFPHKAGSL